MSVFITMALIGGMLVTLSRQVNGRLALSGSALRSSFWNHAVGFLVLATYTFFAASFWPAGASEAPLWAWLGGVFGVVFITGGSWLIPRLGAALTGGLLVAGQMLSGVALDLLRGIEGSAWMRIAGVLLILLGVWFSKRR